jgi:4-diphosphocytidyl-2-C-methyl-D-erythritol kinase
VTGSAAAVAAQAKVNLFLHILAREVSGYHQLETLFCRLTLADDVVVRLAERWTISCDGTDTGPAEQNLAYRAARLYAERRKWPHGCAIEIVKHIPVGAGLGGGSADAGAVLRCLRAMDPEPPSAPDLLDWGARLGADVPALTIDAPLALGHGRGERLLALPGLPAKPVVLYVPAVPVATREAYEWLAASRAGEGATRPRARTVDVRWLSRWESVAPLVSNDFAPVVGERHPEIAQATSELAALPGARACAMSGSGSTVFCVFDSQVPRPWPLPPRRGAALIETETADRVAAVRLID